MIQQDQSFHISDRVRWNQIGMEVTLLDISTETLFGLDGVAKKIWQDLASGCTVAEIIRRITDAYTDVPEHLATDVIRFLENLVDRGWIIQGLPAA